MTRKDELRLLIPAKRKEVEGIANRIDGFNIGNNDLSYISDIKESVDDLEKLIKEHNTL